MTKRKGHIVWKVVTALTCAAVLAAVVYIVAGGLGIREDMDFGAGAYYYADIPGFDKYMAWDAYTPKLPYWIYVVLFLVWGALMYLLWKWIDKKK